MGAALIFLAALLTKEAAALNMSWPPRVQGCMWQPTLPSAIFRDPFAYGWGTGRVQWHVMTTSPRQTEDYFERVNDHYCDALLWQDEDWYSPKDYYTKWRKTPAATQRLTSRILAGWVSERCLRSTEVLEHYDYAWYPAPRDENTHLVPLPLGASAAFPAVNSNYPDLRELQSYTFVVNYLASLETSPVRRAWFEDVKKLANQLDKAAGQCAFIRAHRKWQEPQSYVKMDEYKVEDCNCSNLYLCNNVTVGSLTNEEFYSVVSRSAFTFSPPGHNYQSFRHWEAAASFSIPVVINPKTSESDCIKAESYFFGDAPFVYADSPSAALPLMRELLADPVKLAERRMQVRQWYDQHMHLGVWRVEAAASAAAAIADVIWGPPGPSRLKPRSRFVLDGTQKNRKPKRNAIALALDYNMANQLHYWLYEVHGIEAKRNLFDELRDDGALSVGWNWVCAADWSPWSKSVRAVMDQPLATIKMAPIVVFTRDPLEYVPELAQLVDEGLADKEKFPQEMRKFLHEVVAGDEARNAIAALPPAKTDKPSLRLAARYWFEWTKRAYEMSSFNFRMENFDPVAGMQALGLRHQKFRQAEAQPMYMFKPVNVPRTTWTDLGAALSDAELADMRELAALVRYDLADGAIVTPPQRRDDAA